MFLIYLPSGQAVVQSILNPSLQLWKNVTCILRFMWLKVTIKCSMGQSTIPMGVLLMIPISFCNIWILTQTFHVKLGNAPFYLFGMPRITMMVLQSKVVMIFTCTHKTMVLGWLWCIHIRPRFKFIYEHALFTNDDQGDYQWLAFSSQLLVDHIAIVWIGKEHLCYFQSFNVFSHICQWYVT